jgi:hypothetical protein
VRSATSTTDETTDDRAASLTAGVAQSQYGEDVEGC